MKMNNAQLETNTIRKINAIGEHIVDELKMPKYVKKDPKLRFFNTIVAVSPPQINFTEGNQHEFDSELTSKPLLDIKKS